MYFQVTQPTFSPENLEKKYAFNAINWSRVCLHFILSSEYQTFWCFELKWLNSRSYLKSELLESVTQTQFEIQIIQMQKYPKRWFWTGNGVQSIHSKQNTQHEGTVIFVLQKKYCPRSYRSVIQQNMENYYLSI